MGFLSKMLERYTAKKILMDGVRQIHRLINDEKLQLQLLNPEIRGMVEAGPAWDKNPNGTGPFGFVETNPIPVNGPIGQLAYLSKLETESGQRILFHRLGAIGTVDVFEAVSFNGKEWFILFSDPYHPRRSRLTPEGFTFTQEVGQFSGFTKCCDNFPNDFAEKKYSLPEGGVRIAYIAVGRVSPQIENQVFTRPLAHKAKLDLIMSRLSSFQMQ